MYLDFRTYAGSPSPGTLDKTGLGPLVTQAHAPNVEAALRRKLFIGANPQGTPVTTQAGLSATTPALTIYNPVGSGVAAAILTCAIDITTSPAGVTGFSLAFNEAAAAAPASTTAATLRSAYLSDTSTGAVQAYRVATLATAPVAIWYLGGVTGASSISPQRLVNDINGQLILGPGTALSIQATAAAAIVASISWEEIAI